MVKTRLASNEPIPPSMKALELQSLGELPVLVERPVPQPGVGEVLVRIAAAPIHPTDWGTIIGLRGPGNKLPMIPGSEGSGKVVSAGPGLLGSVLLGRRVACSMKQGGDGTWANYMVTSAKNCFPLSKSVSDEAGSMSLINPLTAWAMMDIAKRGNHKAMANTTAAGALGKMILRLSLRYDYPVVHIVYRKSQVQMLKDLGAEHILDSSSQGFESEMEELFHNLNVTIAYDAIAGKMTNKLLHALPNGGQVHVYSNMSREDPTINTSELTIPQKRVQGLYLRNWNKKTGILKLLWVLAVIQRRMHSDFHTAIQVRYSLEEAAENLMRSTENMTSGKTLILPAE